jgi:D-arabinose 1-dehydrogenase-like Zn-dependent alcohol dehydrogenase
LGAGDVIIVDMLAAKREAALLIGGRAEIDGGAPDAAKQIQQATGGGAWAVIDFVGASSTVNLAMAASVGKGGTIIVVGLFGGDVTVPTPFLPLRAMTLRGSYVGSQSDMAELLELVNRTGMPPVPIRTRPLAEVGDALNELRAGKIVGRVVLTPRA